MPRAFSWKEQPMRILRSITQRGNDIRTAGWFTVVRRNTWFAASRLPDGFHRTGDPSRTLTWTGRQPVAAPSLAVNLNTQAAGPMRLTLTVLGALAITSAMLWWIMHP